MKRLAVINRVGDEFPQDKLFGRDPQGKLDGTIGAIYQGFGGEDIYPSVEDKAANLLYLVVNDHALADGNKRSAAALFVTFLDRNRILYDNEGKSRISNNALAAITLMVAMSDPSEKDLMVALITRMLSGTGSKQQLQTVSLPQGRMEVLPFYRPKVPPMLGFRNLPRG